MNITYNKETFFDQNIGHFIIKVAFTGSYLKNLNESICYIDDKLRCYNIKGKYVLTLSFTPTSKKISGGIDKEHYICEQLNENQNKELNPCITWDGGSHYSLKWNDNHPLAWVMMFFQEELQ